MDILIKTGLYETIMYFMIYAFIGWFIESAFKSLLYQKPINSGFLNGPFIPIYAVGALFIITFLQRFQGQNLKLFLIGFFSMTLIEYITGYIMEKIFNTSWWDYTGNLLNIDGKICLENSIYWGLLTAFFVNFMHPKINNFVSKIPTNIGETVILIFIVYFIIDYTITLMEVLNIQEKVKEFILIRDNPIILATTNRVSELKREILKKSKRLIKTYPKLTYLRFNKKLKDILIEIKK